MIISPRADFSWGKRSAAVNKVLCATVFDIRCRRSFAICRCCDANSSSSRSTNNCICLRDTATAAATVQQIYLWSMHFQAGCHYGQVITASSADWMRFRLVDASFVFVTTRIYNCLDHIVGLEKSLCFGHTWFLKSLVYITALNSRSFSVELFNPSMTVVFRKKTYTPTIGHK